MMMKAPKKHLAFQVRDLVAMYIWNVRILFYGTNQRKKTTDKHADSWEVKAAHPRRPSARGRQRESNRLPLVVCRMLMMPM